jgi:hypothetical protein
MGGAAAQAPEPNSAPVIASVAIPHPLNSSSSPDRTMWLARFNLFGQANLVTGVTLV